MADQKRLDTTVAGGRYLAGDGKTLVDAWGKPLKQEAPVEEPASQDADSTELSSMKFDQLKAMAIDAGIDEEAVGKMRSKAEVIEALEAATEPDDETGDAGDDAGDE